MTMEQQHGAAPSNADDQAHDQHTDLLQTMHELRAMRRIKPDPVPESLIRDVVTYATYAPTPGNTQAWKFVVVTDAELRQKIAGYYAPGIDWLFTHVYSAGLPNLSSAESERVKAAFYWQRDHLGEIPVLIFPCIEGTEGLDFTQHFIQCSFLGGAIFPAIQNLLLACRAKGLGATLTTLHLMHGAEVDALLRLPQGARSCAMIPIGWPMGHFGPVRRRPIETVIAWNRWE
jgi:nitroreductase